MTKESKTQSIYHQMLLSLTQLQKIEAITEWPRILLVFGGDLYFRNKAMRTLRQHFQKTFHQEVSLIEVKETKVELLADQITESGIFGASLFCFEFQDKYFNSLKSQLKSRKIQQYLLMSVNSQIVNKTLQEFLTKNEGMSIPTGAPSPSELSKYIVEMAKTNGLQLGPAAVNLIIESLGQTQFVDIENEVQKLAFYFKDQKNQMIGPEQIRPHLNLLREDHIFLMDHFLLERNYAGLSLHLQDLLRRGESAIGVIALIARHARNSLNIIAYTQNPRSAELPRMPNSVLNHYRRYTSKLSEKYFADILSNCFIADVKLKSSGASGDQTILDSLVASLGSRS